MGLILRYSLNLDKLLRLLGPPFAHLYSKYIVLNTLSHYFIHQFVHLTFIKCPLAYCTVQIMRHISVRSYARTHARTHIHTMAQKVIRATTEIHNVRGCCSSVVGL